MDTVYKLTNQLHTLLRLRLSALQASAPDKAVDVAWPVPQSQGPHADQGCHWQLVSKSSSTQEQESYVVSLLPSHLPETTARSRKTGDVYVREVHLAKFGNKRGDKNLWLNANLLIANGISVFFFEMNTLFVFTVAAAPWWPRSPCTLSLLIAWAGLCTHRYTRITAFYSHWIWSKWRKRFTNCRR